MSQTLNDGAAVLVDQNAYQQKMLRSLLHGSGFSRIAEFNALEEGLNEAVRMSSDFLFADFDTAQSSEMMRCNGDLRKTFLPDNTNLIFLMKHPTRKRVETAIASGAQWIISRPYSPASLYQRIHATLAPQSVSSIKPDRKRPEVDVIELSTSQAETEEERIEHLLQEMDSLLKNSPYFDASSETIAGAANNDARGPQPNKHKPSRWGEARSLSGETESSDKFFLP
ncbi:Response regulator receiver domain-containing protein [Cohaesibacter sp. ES.047]|uniref:response regulator n=1 Tax=Cohaesibacter sp. ES.047 TaxID=1798205 RepID=UPI000BB915B8|nr:response regulator [Cohaesibacter sp. ES.047]SNY90925.1 Response regulator receiver domain-containing protein [Cohaesibacter sp. ES.047]